MRSEKVIAVISISLIVLFLIAGCGTIPKDVGKAKDTEREDVVGKMDSDKESKSSMKEEEKADYPSPKPEPPPAEDEESFDAEPPSPAPKLETTPSVSGLKAGYADDNKQFNYFLNFLEEYKSRTTNYYPIDIQERIILKATDNDGKSLPNSAIKIYANEDLVTEGKTFADGSFLFFPLLYAQPSDKYTAEISYMQHEKRVEFDREGKRELDVVFDRSREEMTEIPLDILFILDTTGSMGEEIHQLKTTIELIHLNLASLSGNIKVRFGMVLYKDIGDSYVTKIVPLTADLEAFQAELNLVEADGGGDTPEDLQSALHDAIQAIQWNSQGIRLSFIITDAPPHLDYDQDYNYVDAAIDAKRRGIKIFSVGTSGLDINGEYILRQISQFTSGKYIFLTYGETGESDGGRIGSVSHHTGENFQTDKLEAIIIRFAKEELSHVTDRAFDIVEEYFEARKIPDEEKDETLNMLFEMCVSQLVDYSSYKIQSGTRLALLPFALSDSTQTLDASYFHEQLSLILTQKSTFNMVERKDLKKIMNELALHMSGAIEESEAIEVGNQLGAEMLLAGRMYEKSDNYELFLKLLRVETGEVLSVTKVKIDRELGLTSR